MLSTLYFTWDVVRAETTALVLSLSHLFPKKASHGLDLNFTGKLLLLNPSDCH